MSAPTLVPVDGGFRVAETETHYIHALHMLFNWRLVEVSKANPFTYGRFWCYVGNDPAALLAVCAAVRVWIETGAPEPPGWSKNGQTGEWREPP